MGINKEFSELNNKNYLILKEIKIRSFYLNFSKDYGDGYTKALLDNKLITENQFNDLRKTYWEILKQRKLKNGITD